jgi:crotonobetainyl-CoA:carnitine CoA-transferase CaiB-like acyl-CoA transferase
VLTVPEIVTDEQFLARDDYADAHDATAGDFRQVGPVFAGMARPTEPYEARDMTVTDTDALLRAAGLADDELAKLHESGVIA